MSLRAAVRITGLFLLFLFCAPAHVLTKLVVRRSPWPPWFLAASAWIIGARVRRTGKTLGLMFVDLDHFKKVNDTYGHEAGNLVLTQVARIIRQCSRTSDVPARWGGDEFTVLLTETDPTSLEMIARRVRDSAMHAQYRVAGGANGVEGLGDGGCRIRVADERHKLARILCRCSGDRQKRD